MVEERQFVIPEASKGFGNEKDLKMYDDYCVIYDAAERIQENIANTVKMSIDERNVREIALSLKKKISNDVQLFLQKFEDIRSGVDSQERFSLDSQSEHDLNTPKRAVQFFTLQLDYFLSDHRTEEQIPNTQDFFRHVHVIGSSLDRVVYVIQDLCARLIGQSTVPEQFIEADKGKQLHRLINGWKNLIEERRGAGRDIDFFVDPAVYDLRIHAAHGVLWNKVWNIISNASYGRSDIQANYVQVNIKKLDSDMVEIRISDDGVGIPKRKQEKIFEKGYTTKTGLGLGLSDANKQIESMGGTITVESKRVFPKKKDDFGREIKHEFLASSAAPPEDDMRERAGNGKIHTTFIIRIPINK